MSHTHETAAVRLRHAFRLCKRDDAGAVQEFVTFDDSGRPARVVTRDSDPAEFARLTALEQAGAPAE